MRETIAVVCPNMLPVPTSKGGAIETLVEHLANENENENKYDFIIYSTFDEEALRVSKKYKYTKFVFLKNNKRLLFFNTKLNRGFKKIFRLKFPILYYEKISNSMSKYNVNKIVVQASFECAEYLKDRFKDKDIYLHIHSDDFSVYNERMNDIVKKMSKVICVSEFIKNQAEKSGYDVRNFEVVKNCIEVERFNKELYKNEGKELREKYNIASDEKVILFSGRLIPVKGIKELIIAFKKIDFKYKCRLLIVGNAGFGEAITGEYDQELYDLAKDISEKIIFTGFIANKDLPKIHAICDIAVVPSIWEEAAGLVVIEAMCSGIPLIVTDSGGIHEYTGNNGVIQVKRGERLIDELYLAIEELLKNNKLREENIRIAKEYVKQFNTNKFYDDFIKIIKN